MSTPQTRSTTSGDGAAPDDTDLRTRRRRARWRTFGSLLLMAVVCSFVAAAVLNNWTAVRDDLAALPVWSLLASGALGALALLLAAAAWMTVLDSLGHGMRVHDGLTVFFAGQLGKYAPGSVWPAIIQAELGRRNGVPRAQMLNSYLVAFTISLAACGSVALLSVAGDGGRSVAALAVVGAVSTFLLAGCVLHRNGVQRWIRPVLARFGRSMPAIDVSGRAVATAAVLSVGSWIAFGLHAWVISAQLGMGTRDMLPMIGAFALAFLAGIVVLPLPAGAGVREAVLILVLGASLGRPAAITLALVSRFVLVLVEVGLAVITGVPRSVRRGAGERRVESA